MKCTLYFLLLVFVLCTIVIDAKPKKTSSKFEGDFEFVDEDDKDNQPKQSSMSEKKKWIHDPSSDLCKPLNCKKKELCLLEDAYTAVCVSKKELHKNRDEIVSKTKYLEAEAKRTADLEDNDELQIQDESEGDDTSDDDVFYDTEDKDMDEENCKPCPVVKPTFLCGSDNRTYSSLCRLDYHNCIHTTVIKVACKGFCPCKDSNESKKRQKMADRINAFNMKYQRTIQQTQNDLKQQQLNEILSSESENKNTNHLNNNNIATEYKFIPEDVRYENKHYKYIKYTTYNKNKKIYDNNNGNTKVNSVEDKHKIRGYNDVIEKPSNYNNRLKENNSSQKTSKLLKTECKPPQLTAIGNRLLDWFSVIMADTKKRHTRVEKTKIHFPPTCKMEAKWMFGHLDLNNDGLLSSQEMYDLEHDQNEKCIKPFIDNCDTDTDMNLTPHEWCRCFEQSDRPCAAVRRRLTGDLIGSYAPDCDIQGFYKPTQCHSSVGVCWCVDKHGVEFANTRTRGKPACDDVSSKNGIDVDLESDDDDEESDDDDDDDDSLEGSADRLLVF